tara:strand:- start:269 stop:493 length:225 start_codon:yes stop_codon:yes gene_type:complete
MASTEHDWDGSPVYPKGRNPYEMRFDLLHLAKDILEQNAHMAREDKGSDRKTFYTLAEVIETADELNKFVSNKK